MVRWSSERGKAVIMIQFNATEIRQYQDVFLRWRNCNRRAIPSRYSRNVIDHACIFGFAQRGENGRTIYISEKGWLTGHDLPDEVLWAFVKETVEQRDGFGITRDPIWQTLNFDKGDTQSVETCLLRLDRAGFIHFFSAGSVWRIFIKERA